MLVLILADEGDDHADLMRSHLERRGAAVRMHDARWFPTMLETAYDPIADRGTLGMTGGRPIEFREIHAVYWRNFSGVGVEPLPNRIQTEIADNDARSLFESLLIRWPCRWVNGWRAYQLHQTKPVQLAMVASLGVEVPATLLTNSPAAVRQFAADYARAIFKPVQGGAHARRLTAEHLTDERLQRLKMAPLTLQEEIPGTNIRVFVAGRRVLACEIATDAVDFRDDAEPRLSVHELPEPIIEQSLRIAETLELCWTGIDFRLTPDGRYVYLEANPSPMFLGFEEQTGLSLTEALGDVLLGND